MGTLAAGIKDIFSTAKTTGTNVMLSGNDGTPDGHISMVNLAAVLGAFKPQSQVTSGSANDCKDIGFYIIRTGVTDLPSAFLNTFATFIYTFSNGGAGVVGSANTYIQIASNYSVEGIYIRKGCDNNWSAWSRADGFGYENFSGLVSAINTESKSLFFSITTSKTDGWKDLNVPTNLGSFLIVITTFYESCIISVQKSSSAVVKIGGTSSPYQAVWKASESDPITSAEVYCFTYTNNKWRIMLGISSNNMAYSIHVLY